MSLGEEADQPGTGGDRLVSEESAGPEGADAPVESSLPSSVVAVVIAEDGSVTIDGMPVPLADGESVDVAVLDTLHGYARSRNTPVTGAITESPAGHMAIIEVSPDGSSRLLDQMDGWPAAPAGVEELPGPDERTPADPSRTTPLPAVPRAEPYESMTPFGQEPGPARRMPQSDEEYEAPGLLKRPLTIGVVGVAVAVVVVIPLAVLGSGSGGGDGGAQDRAGDSATAVSPPSSVLPTQVTPAFSGPVVRTPSPSSSASSHPHPHSNTPSASAKPPAKHSAAADTAADTDTDTVTNIGTDGDDDTEAPKAPKPAAKPKGPTAATTVVKLASQSPGRHICYRVYFADGGWQKPVCDGATAGQVKSGRKIKSINIAVSGTDGVSANVYVKDSGWRVPWHSADDGADDYVGGTTADAPYILGFGIKVGDDTVCENAQVHTKGWHGVQCNAPGDIIFGGTLDNSRWLEAVRFTV
ncbi:hypothetical protein [Streptomyces sp. NPDC047061]|uniref:hypothetical protein n=1 Tax=Streptomyces sp. NPDC047061 TaxID=3154605 RepID=UPI00340D2067